MWKDDRLRWKTGGSDVEASSSGGSGGAAKAPRAASKLAGVAAAGAMGGAARVLGVVPLRVLLLGAYLTVLHIAVMVSFTRTSDLSKLCADKVLPGGETQARVLP